MVKISKSTYYREVAYATYQEQIKIVKETIRDLYSKFIKIQNKIFRIKVLLKNIIPLSSPPL